MTSIAICPLAGMGDWWLPTNYSVHGSQIDALFTFIFWLTAIIFILVQITLIVFLIRYRARPNKVKGTFIHGNTKLEMTWTLVPAVILLLLSLVSKRVWDNYRYSPDLDDPRAAHVLVIARQFNWNAIYSGPDGKLGQYMVFPKPSDQEWPRDAKGRPVTFAGVPGPSSLSQADARAAIQKYVAAADAMDAQGPNFFGKVFDPKEDPDGVDDVINTPVGQLELPVNRPTTIDLTSLDVIHDFYLPNFRVNVYAVPGSRVRVVLTPTMTSKDKEKASAKLYNVDDLPALMADPTTKELTIDIDDTTPGTLKVNKEKDRTGWRYFSTDARHKKSTVMRNGSPFPADPDTIKARVDELKALGITQVQAHIPGYFEIVCAQLCGNQHTQMEGKIYVLSQEEWSAKYENKSARAEGTGPSGDSVSLVLPGSPQVVPGPLSVVPGK